MKIEMTDKKGIRLLTAGKKCAEDIEVVPTFDMAETVQIGFANIQGYDITFHYCTCENGEIVNKTVTIDANGDIVEGDSYNVEVVKNTIVAISSNEDVFITDYYNRESEAVVEKYGLACRDGYYKAVLVAEAGSIECI